MVDERNDEHDAQSRPLYLTCSRCGKRIARVPGASLTGWIFRESRCHCQMPEIEFVQEDDDADARADGTMPPVDFPESLSEDFEILEELGTGGMGAVFKVKDRREAKVFAIKILRRDLARDRASRKRFLNEARVVSTLAHPNIISVIDFGLSDEGTPFILMEYLEGKTLWQILKETGMLSLTRCTQVLLQIGQALVHAHENGITHRDIKPSNVIIMERDGELKAKLVDFGIAKLSDGEKTITLTRTGQIIGSPYYMSPEQCRGEELDFRSDIYSYGCMFYECLCGRPPFHSNSAVKIIIDHLTERPVSLTGQNPSVSKDAERIVLKCLQKERSKRYQSFTQIIEDMRCLQMEVPLKHCDIVSVRSDPPLLALAAASIASLAIIMTLIGSAFQLPPGQGNASASTIGLETMGKVVSIVAGILGLSAAALTLRPSSDPATLRQQGYLRMVVAIVLSVLFLSLSATYVFLTRVVYTQSALEMTTKDARWKWIDPPPTFSQPDAKKFPELKITPTLKQFRQQRTDVKSGRAPVLTGATDGVIGPSGENGFELPKPTDPSTMHYWSYKAQNKQITRADARSIEELAKAHAYYGNWKNALQLCNYLHDCGLEKSTPELLTLSYLSNYYLHLAEGKAKGSLDALPAAIEKDLNQNGKPNAPPIEQSLEEQLEKRLILSNSLYLLGRYDEALAHYAAVGKGMDSRRSLPHFKGNDFVWCKAIVSCRMADCLRITGKADYAKLQALYSEGVDEWQFLLEHAEDPRLQFFDQVTDGWIAMSALQTNSLLSQVLWCLTSNSNQRIYPTTLMTLWNDSRNIRARNERREMELSYIRERALTDSSFGNGRDVRWAHGSSALIDCPWKFVRNSLAGLAWKRSYFAEAMTIRPVGEDLTSQSR